MPILEAGRGQERFKDEPVPDVSTVAGACIVQFNAPNRLVTKGNGYRRGYKVHAQGRREEDQLVGSCRLRPNPIREHAWINP